MIIFKRNREDGSIEPYGLSNHAYGAVGCDGVFGLFVVGEQGTATSSYPEERIERCKVEFSKHPSLWSHSGDSANDLSVIMLSTTDIVKLAGPVDGKTSNKYKDSETAAWYRAMQSRLTQAGMSKFSLYRLIEKCRVLVGFDTTFDMTENSDGKCLLECVFAVNLNGVDAEPVCLGPAEVVKRLDQYKSMTESRIEQADAYRDKGVWPAHLDTPMSWQSVRALKAVIETMFEDEKPKFEYRMNMLLAAAERIAKPGSAAYNTFSTWCKSLTLRDMVTVLVAANSAAWPYVVYTALSAEEIDRGRSSFSLSLSPGQPKALRRDYAVQFLGNLNMWATSAVEERLLSDAAVHEAVFEHLKLVHASL